MRRYLLILAAVVAGCSSQGVSAQYESSERSIRPDVDSLAVYLDIPVTTAEQEWAAMQVEELIATCMKEGGFDYSPFVVAVGSVNSGIDGVVPNTAEFYEKFGFGHSTTLFSQQKLPDGLIGTSSENSTTESLEDPNNGKSDEFLKYLDGEFDPTTGEQISTGCVDSSNQKIQEETTALDRAYDVWSQYRVDVAALTLNSEQWKAYVEEMTVCFDQGGFSEAADVLANSLLTDPEENYPLSGYVFDRTTRSLDMSLGEHDKEGHEQLRSDQSYELDLAVRALECDWLDRPSVFLETSRPYEEQVWLSMESDILGAREELGRSGWALGVE